MTILIPAYKPDERLIQLVKDLLAQSDYAIVVVDDGSGPEYRSIFNAVAELGCTVLTHERNKGKGAALKTGFHYIQTTEEKIGVVTADGDGQHLPQDIHKVAGAVKNERKTIVLGTRRFVGKVPLRSRFGNSLTRAVFSLVSGAKVYDTQTGLRGFSVDMLPWLCEVAGDRYEYEMNVLMEAVPAGYRFKEIDIETVYVGQNETSHFHAVKDSLRVYWPILKFSMSSLLSALLDFALLIIIKLSTNDLFLAVIGARICSTMFNYTLNRQYVFAKGKEVPIKYSMPKYLTLAAIVMLANYVIIEFYYTTLGLSLVMAKILTEATIFFLNYWAQRRFVFVR